MFAHGLRGYVSEPSDLNQAARVICPMAVRVLLSRASIEQTYDGHSDY
jgi:hypothetical protein